MTLPQAIYENRLDQSGLVVPWDTQSIHELLCQTSPNQNLRATERALEDSGLLPATLKLEQVTDEHGEHLKRSVSKQISENAKRKRYLSLVIQIKQLSELGKNRILLFANDGRAGRKWLYLDALHGKPLNNPLNRPCLLYTSPSPRDS